MLTASPMKSENVKWQIPLEPRGNSERRYRVRFDLASEEVKAKFVELYPVSYNREMAEWFGVSKSTIEDIGIRKLRLRKDKAAIGRRVNSTRDYPSEGNMARMRDEEPERYAALNRQRSEVMKKRWRKAKRELLYGMKPTTKMRPSLLSSRMQTSKGHYIRCYHYFSDPNHPYWLCYDSQTRRSATAEANAIAKGFKIVEGAD